MEHKWKKLTDARVVPWVNAKDGQPGPETRRVLRFHRARLAKLTRGALYLPPFPGTLVTMDIPKSCSPEAAIKLAYDFAKNLTASDVADAHLSEHLDMWVERPYRANPLLPYIRAGFSAGYQGKPLPWRRDIEADRGRSSV